MTNIIASSEKNVVIGMGLTGRSVVRFLRAQNRSPLVLDTRAEPPDLDGFVREFPDVDYRLGELDKNLLQTATRIIVSPGVALAEPAITTAMEAGVPVLGDVQLFLEAVDQPVVAITGSNAKSTVTSLVGEMAKATGIKVAVAGNIGTPVLDLLLEEREKVQATQLYVLELSSFQLETIETVNAEVACVLNVSLDHMDRYPGLAEYHQAKQRIYRGAKKIVINRDDPLTAPPIGGRVDVISFGLDQPDLKQFGVRWEAGDKCLAYGLDILLNARELKLAGSHNLANVLAALAIGQHLQLPMDTMLETAKHFTGLPHRCEWVACIDGVDFINDSKGTNVGATLAALEGLSRDSGNIILIVGGVGKGADFSPLKEAIRLWVSAVITLGEDGPVLAALAESAGVATEAADTMQTAVTSARRKAKAGDLVLLSPACASLDMFRDYRHRGDEFRAAVKELAA